MSLRRLACSVLSLSLLGGLASAHPYRYQDDLVRGVEPELTHFAEPPPDAPVRAEPNPAMIHVDRAKVRAALTARRAQNLALFRAYRDGGVYPHNFVQAGKLNVWQDDEGHLCAAATLISNSGNFDLAMTVPATNNFLRLKDVTEGPLMDWMLTSGFTQEEIDAIQEPFMGRMQPIDEPALDPRRVAEDARLRKRYNQVDRMLTKGKRKSLDRAVDRLMARPDLARDLLASV